MSIPAQPAIDALEAALTSAQKKLASYEAELAGLRQQVATGVLTDAQAAKMKTLHDVATSLGK